MEPDDLLDNTSSNEYEVGYEAGRADSAEAIENARTEGYDDGREDGYNEGYDEGLQAGRDESPDEESIITSAFEELDYLTAKWDGDGSLGLWETKIKNGQSTLREFLEAFLDHAR